MKTLTRLFILSILIFLGTSARAEDLMSLAAPEKNEAVEEFAAAAETTEKASGQLELVVGKTVYVVEAPEDRAAYEALSESDRVQFQRNRRIFLTQAARAMTALKYGFGTGSIVKNKLRYSYRAVLRREQEAKSDLSFSQRSNLVVGQLLQSLDRTLWPQASLLTRANEFGVVASVGVEALGGVGAKGWGGLFDVGISFGYNSDTHALVFQIIAERERYKSTAMKAVFVAGALLKAGPYVANQREGLAHRGSSFYPPGVPMYSSMTNDSFATGFSTGLTIPPSPLGDMLTYTNTLAQDTLVRISISPMLKGFVRVQSGVGSAIVRTTIDSAVEAVGAVVAKVRGGGLSRGGMTCSALFAL